MVVALVLSANAAVAASSIDGQSPDAATLLSLCEADPGNAVCVELAGQRAADPQDDDWVPTEAVLGTPRIQDIDDFDRIMGANLPGYSRYTRNAILAELAGRCISAGRLHGPDIRREAVLERCTDLLPTIHGLDFLVQPAPTQSHTQIQSVPQRASDQGGHTYDACTQRLYVDGRVVADGCE